jgi:hypothetical protein
MRALCGMRAQAGKTDCRKPTGKKGLDDAHWKPAAAPEMSVS